MTSAPPHPPSVPSKESRRALLQRALDAVFGYDFFISYTRRDGGREYAEALARKLEGAGFHIFFDSDDYAMGDDWKEQGKWALHRTSQLILVASPEALSSPPVVREVEIYSKLKGRRIIPIDFGGTVRQRDASKPIFQHLAEEILFIQENPTQLGQGPTDFVVQKIRDGFHLKRQDAKRARVFTFAITVLVMLTLLTSAAAWLAYTQKQEAVTQTGKSYLLYAGRLQEELRADEAVAYLCRALRADPGSQLAKDKLLCALAFSGFIPPVGQYDDPKTFGARIRGMGFASLAMSEDGKSLLISDNVYKRSHDLAVWDTGSASTKLNLPTLPEPGHIWNRLTVSPDGRHLLSDPTEANGYIVYPFPQSGDPLLQSYSQALALSQQNAEIFNQRSSAGEVPESDPIRVQMKAEERRVESLEAEWQAQLKSRKIEIELSDGGNEPDGTEEGDEIRDPAISQRGELVLLRGRVAQVWSVQTCAAVSPPLRLDQTGRSQAISRDGSTVVVGDAVGRLHVWHSSDWSKKAATLTFGEQKDMPRTLETPRTVGLTALSADGRMVTACMGRRHIASWSLPEGDARMTHECPGDVAWMKLSASGNMAIIACDDGRGDYLIEFVRTDRYTDQEVADTPGVIAFSLDASQKRVLLTQGRAAWLRDAETGHLLAAPITAPGKVTSVAFGMNDSRVALGTQNGFAGIYDLSAALLPVPKHVLHGTLGDVAVAGSYAATYLDHKLQIVNLETGQKTQVPMQQEVNQLCFSPDGTVLAAALDEKILLLTPSTGTPLLEDLTLEKTAGSAGDEAPVIRDLQFSRDGTRLVVISNGGTVSDEGDWPQVIDVWDWRQRQRLSRQVSSAQESGYEAQINDAATRIAATASGKYEVWIQVEDVGTSSKSPVFKHEGERSADSAALLSPDGSLIAIRANNSVQLLQVADAKPRCRPIVLDDGVSSLSFSKNGLELAIGTKGGAVQVWDATSGVALSPPMMHKGTITALAMDERSLRVITGTAGKGVRIWDVRSGEALTPFLPFTFSESESGQVGFGKSGRVFAISSERLSVWDLPEAGPSEFSESFLKLAEAVAGRQLDLKGVPSAVPFVQRRDAWLHTGPLTDFETECLNKWFRRP